MLFCSSTAAVLDLSLCLFIFTCCIVSIAGMLPSAGENALSSGKRQSPEIQSLNGVCGRPFSSCGNGRGFMSCLRAGK